MGISDVSSKFAELVEDDPTVSDRQKQLAARTSLGDEIYEVLLAQLISLRIPPGSRISIDALVRELGVSQTPIRSALIRLEAEGLVVKRHNTGYSAAAMPSGERFRNIYEFRLLLEPYAVANATSRMTAADRAKLTAINDEMAALVTADPKTTYGKFAMLDARFHEFIADHCGNDLVSETLGRLYAHMHLFRLRYHSTVTEQAIKEHALIISAMNALEPDAAASAMRAHITSSRMRMEPYYQLLK